MDDITPILYQSFDQMNQYLRGVVFLFALVPALCGCGRDDSNRIVGEDQAAFREFAEQALAESEVAEESPDE